MNVIVLMGVVALATAQTKTLPEHSSTTVPVQALLGARPADRADGELALLRAEQQAALARGDRAAVSRIEHEIQAMLARKQAGLNLPVPKLQVLNEPPDLMADAGPDVLIRQGRVTATAADYEPDGTMWVALACLDSINHLYFSTDHGTTWNHHVAFQCNQLFRKLGLVVGQGDSNFIHIFVISQDYSGDLYDFRFSHDGSTYQMLPVRVGWDTVSDFSVARQPSGGNHFLYAMVNNELRTAPPLYNAFFLRSGDFGRTWVVCESLMNVLKPHISAGSDAWVYFTCTMTPATNPGMVGHGVSRLFGSPGSWNYTVVWPDTFRVADPVIGAAFTQPESLAVIWCLYAHNYQNSADWDVLYSFSTNGGNTWTTGNILAYSGDVEAWPDLKNYASPNNPWMNASYIRAQASGDRTIYRQYASSAAPTNWSDTLRINTTSAATGREIRPLLVYSPGSSGTGAGLVFVGVGMLNLYWNAPWMSGIQEQRKGGSWRTLKVEPSIGSGPFRVTGARPDATVAVYDRTGCLVRTLSGNAVWEGTDKGGRRLGSGVYFLRLAGDKTCPSAKLVIR